MKLFVYPAVFFKENGTTVIFPDLDIFTEGDSVEEAFLFAKDYLRQFLETSQKYELGYNLPSKYETVQEKYKPAQVMLIDAAISENKKGKV
ncbi:MAG: hypothetical protein RR140_00170 [Clostridia bacterium]